MIKGELAESVIGLKAQHGGNLISFGCGEFAYELAKQGLADEIHFWVNPAVWGGGGRPFHGRQVRIRLIATTAFDSGVVLLAYRPLAERAGDRDDLTSPGSPAAASFDALPARHGNLCVRVGVRIRIIPPAGGAE